MPIQETGLGQDGTQTRGGEYEPTALDPGIPLTMFALALFVGAGRPDARAATARTTSIRAAA